MGSAYSIANKEKVGNLHKLPLMTHSLIRLKVVLLIKVISTIRFHYTLLWWYNLKSLLTN